MSADGYEAGTFDDAEMVEDMMRTLVGSTPAGVSVWTNGEGGALPLRTAHSRSQAPLRLVERINASLLWRNAMTALESRATVTYRCFIDS